MAAAGGPGGVPPAGDRVSEIIARLGAILRDIPKDRRGANMRHIPTPGDTTPRYLFPAIIQRQIDQLDAWRIFAQDETAWNASPNKKLAITKILEAFNELLTATAPDVFPIAELEAWNLLQYPTDPDNSPVGIFLAFLRRAQDKKRIYRAIQQLADTRDSDNIKLAWIWLRGEFIELLGACHLVLDDDIRAPRPAAAAPPPPPPPPPAATGRRRLPPPPPPHIGPSGRARTPGIAGIIRNAKNYAKDSAAAQNATLPYATQPTDGDKLRAGVKEHFDKIKEKVRGTIARKKGFDDPSLATATGETPSYYSADEQARHLFDMGHIYVNQGLDIVQTGHTWGAAQHFTVQDDSGSAVQFMHTYFSNDTDFAIVIDSAGLQFRTPEQLMDETDPVVLASSAAAQEVRRIQVLRMGNDRDPQFLVIDLVNGTDANGKPIYFRPNPSDPSHAIALIATARKFMDEGGTMPIFNRTELDCIIALANNADPALDNDRVDAEAMLEICQILYHVGPPDYDGGASKFRTVSPADFEQAKLIYAQHFRLDPHHHAENVPHVRAGILDDTYLPARTGSTPSRPTVTPRWTHSTGSSSSSPTGTGSSSSSPSPPPSAPTHGSSAPSSPPHSSRASSGRPPLPPPPPPGASGATGGITPATESEARAALAIAGVMLTAEVCLYFSDKYARMLGAGLPEGAIKNAIGRDFSDPTKAEALYPVICGDCKPDEINRILGRTTPPATPGSAVVGPVI